MVTLSYQLSHLTTWKPHAAETMQGNWFSYCLTWHHSLSESPTTHARGKGMFYRSCQSSMGVLSPKKPKQICKEALVVIISFVTPDLTELKVYSIVLQQTTAKLFSHCTEDSGAELQLWECFAWCSQGPQFDPQYRRVVAPPRKSINMKSLLKLLKLWCRSDNMCFGCGYVKCTIHTGLLHA